MPEEQNNNEPVEPYAQRRIAICNECPEYRLFICGKCGCMMPLKTRIKGATCPLGKWTAEQ